MLSLNSEIIVYLEATTIFIIFKKNYRFSFYI